ncbi:MAG: hypothetical protein GF350_06405 [Chitinivibrionales bacterium]|nr:hypothetical protein [Chitinivibrionales bacterium]
MTNIPGDAFWSQEKKKLWDTISEILILLIHAGGESGYEQLPESIKMFMGWDYFNKEAIKFLRDYRLSWVDDISETTREQTIDAIADWIEAGEPKQALDTKLAKIISPERAQRIATTEVTRIFARGNKLAWKATRIVTAQKWQTAQDERVCPLCGPLHGKIVSIDESYRQTPDEIANSQQMTNLVGGDTQARMKRAQTLIKHSNSVVEGPPRHVNCRCWLLPVVSEEAIREERQKRLGLTAEIDDVDEYIAWMKEDDGIVWA